MATKVTTESNIPPTKQAFYQGYVYNIVFAASNAGYTLIKKRKFDSFRYPGYEHVQTKRNQSANVTDEGKREFIFQKVNITDFETARAGVQDKQDQRLIEQRLINSLTEKLLEHSGKKCNVQEGCFYKKSRSFFSCSSDEDSSDYEEASTST